MTSIRMLSSNAIMRMMQPWLPGVFLATLALLQPWLEQSMLRHMGIELPLLFILGWFAARMAGPRLTHAFAPWNMAGIPSLVFSMLVLSVWMIPTALDYAVLNGPIAMLKVISLLLAGILTGLSWKAAGIIIQAFFTLNWFWMTFFIGLLYRDIPQQLCSVYLVDEQASTGLAMMAWAVVGLALWIPSVVQEICRWDRKESQ